MHFRGRVRHSLHKQVFDHSSFTAPVNLFMLLFSGVPRTAYLDPTRFPELNELQSHWQEIREEALALEFQIKAAGQHDDAGFNSFFKTGWKRFYLKWYGDAHPSARTLCPKTTEILSRLPSVKAAMFAHLPHGAKLGKHRDPYAGSLRYHLGLVTPNDTSCFIEVDGERYSWKDGEGVVFDETFIHFAENKSGQDRIVLFCDIERPMRFRFAQAINHWIGTHVLSAASSPNEASDPTGANQSRVPLRALHRSEAPRLQGLEPQRLSGDPNPANRRRDCTDHLYLGHAMAARINSATHTDSP